MGLDGCQEHAGSDRVRRRRRQAVPLAQQEVDRILHTAARDGERPRAQVEFSLGESVKVTSGPLSDFDGEVVDVNADQQKLKVLVDIFERQVPVELTFDQVKKLD